MRDTLIYEVIAIGVMSLVLTYILNYIIKGMSPIFDYQQMVIPFLVGALIHILFEFTGMNEKWCRMTYI